MLASSRCVHHCRSTLKFNFAISTLREYRTQMCARVPAFNPHRRVRCCRTMPSVSLFVIRSCTTFTSRTNYGRRQRQRQTNAPWTQVLRMRWGIILRLRLALALPVGGVVVDGIRLLCSEPNWFSVTIVRVVSYVAHSIHQSVYSRRTNGRTILFLVRGEHST